MSLAGQTSYIVYSIKLIILLWRLAPYLFIIFVYIYIIYYICTDVDLYFSMQCSTSYTWCSVVLYHVLVYTCTCICTNTTHKSSDLDSPRDCWTWSSYYNNIYIYYFSKWSLYLYVYIYTCIAVIQPGFLTYMHVNSIPYTQVCIYLYIHPSHYHCWSTSWHLHLYKNFTCIIYNYILLYSRYIAW